ncbi:hypothetical protein [Fusibacter sp. 3D3]|uniref:hypothetical protein n=1 Tax=Fusibacter sp. 3D3 TaxID=1048380 RepID=UPI0008534C3F|nr:hypothetical protein [Fusibacter sp. 3D3]GAU78364.1 hypothetical protein F3D3_2997 [Fusibacter sp. 3D3]
MKKYLSVLMIASRSTLYKVIGLLFLMTAAEILAFVKLSNSENLYTLETFITESHIPLISGIGFLALCFILSMVGFETSGSKIRYSIKRLPVHEKTIVSLWSLYHMGCFLIFWALQLLILLFLCYQYTRITDPLYWHNQTLFLAFYQNPFLHSLLPLEEGSRWVRNGAMIFALGITSASFSLNQRRDKKGISIVVLAALTFLSFSQDMGDFGADLFLIIVTLSVSIYAFYKIWWGDCHDC